LNYPVISTITSFEKDNRDFPKFIRNVTKIYPQSGGSPRDLLPGFFLRNFIKFRDSGKCLPDNLVSLPEIFSHIDKGHGADVPELRPCPARAVLLRKGAGLVYSIATSLVLQCPRVFKKKFTLTLYDTCYI
jgi:hypothetical protein